MIDVDGFLSFAEAHGFSISNPIFDNKVHRFKRNGSHKENGWYIGFTDSGIAQFGDWKTDETYEYKPSVRPARPPAQVKRTCEADPNIGAKNKLDAQKLAQKIWAVGRNIEDSDYFARKKITEYYTVRMNFDQNGYYLVVPTYKAGNLVGIQRIYDNGDKRFMKGQLVEGIYYETEGTSDTIYICEGVATAHSITMATGCKTIVSFSAQYLSEVVGDARERHLHSQFIIAGDDDKHEEAKKRINKGRKYASEAAQTHGLGLVFPRFSSAKDNPTDFNDLHVMEGLDMVAQQLKEVQFPAKKTPKTPLSEKKTGKKGPKKCNKLYNLFDSSEIPHRYKVIRQENGETKFVKIDERLGIAKDYVAEAIISEILGHFHSDFDLSQNEAREMFNVWKSKEENIRGPIDLLGPHKDSRFYDQILGTTLLSKTNPGLFYCRLPWELDPNGECPLFDEIGSRAGNWPAAEAFIGSVFVMNSNQEQYLWLHGDGCNGKGSLIHCLSEILEPITMVKSSEHVNNFWRKSLVDKRLAVLPECNDTEFPTSDLLKSIVGADRQPIEGKGKDEISLKLQAKVIMASNVMPEITMSASDKRRCIFVPIGPISGKQYTKYREQLLAESPVWVSKCIQKYYELCPNHDPIPTDPEIMHNLIEISNERFDAIIDDRLLTPDKEDYKDLPKYKQPFLLSSELLQLDREFNLNNTESKKFRHYLVKKFNAIYGVITDPKTGRSKKGYHGICNNGLWGTLENEKLPNPVPRIYPK